MNTRWETFLDLERLADNPDGGEYRTLLIRTRSDPFGPKVNGVLTYSPEMQRHIDRLNRFGIKSGRVGLNWTLAGWVTYPPGANC